MAEYDPIAENQTNKVITELESRDDGDQLVNKALAASLRFMQKQAARMDEMDRKLWTAGELERMIDSRHNQSCANCPAKKYVEGMNSPRVDRQSWIALLTNPSFVLSLIAIVTVLMMLRMLGGQGAYRDVMQTPSAFHGGQK